MKRIRISFHFAWLNYLIKFWCWISRWCVALSTTSTTLMNWMVTRHSSTNRPWHGIHVSPSCVCRSAHKLKQTVHQKPLLLKNYKWIWQNFPMDTVFEGHKSTVSWQNLWWLRQAPRNEPASRQSTVENFEPQWIIISQFEWKAFSMNKYRKASILLAANPLTIPFLLFRWYWWLEKKFLLRVKMFR